MTLEFLPAAEQELAEATAHYEEAELGLGVRFREEVHSATAAVLLHPLLWRRRRGSCRRVKLPGFPHYVAYVLRGQRECVSSLSVTARVSRATSATVSATHPPPDCVKTPNVLRQSVVFSVRKSLLALISAARL